MTGSEACTDKEVEVAIQVNVGERHRAEARFACRDALRSHAWQRAYLEFALSFLRHFVVRHRHKQFLLCAWQRQYAALISRRGEIMRQRNKTMANIISVDGELPPCGCGHDQIFPAIAIDIKPTYSGSQPAEASRQARLRRPVIKGV